MTITTAIFSDPHSGHRKGLLAPGTMIEDLDSAHTWEIELTEYNRYLWNLYNRQLDTVRSSPHDVGLIVNGDLFWGCKYPSGTIDTSEFVQIEVALAVIRPWYETIPNLRWVRFVGGTSPAHEFSEFSALRRMVGELKRDYKNIDTHGMYHGLIRIEDFLIDAAHHGPPPGSRSWLSGNMARFYLRDMVMRHLLSGIRPPDLFLRSHYHRKLVEVLYLNDKEYRLIVTPSFMGMTDHSQKVTRSEYELTNGGLILDITGNQISRTQWITETLDLRTTEAWK